MSWDMSDEELQRVRSLAVRVRYTYAINKIRRHAELWTLASDDGWVVSQNEDGQRTIPIWPHEQLAALEATDVWADATPVRVSLDGWLGETRASWFEAKNFGVAVFLVGASSMFVPYAELAALLRGAPPRSSGVALEPKRATRAWDDVVPYVNRSDIDLVIERVPDEFRSRLRDIFRRRSSDAKILGSVTTRGRRDVELSTLLPLRVSLRAYLHGGQSAAEFGAPERGQWPPWAVRRFLLYDVLLHEIGHLQVVDPKASRVQRRFASETRAQEIADELRRTLYSEHFEHPDPVHNAPTAPELATLEVWNRLDKPRRALLVREVLEPGSTARSTMSLLEPMTAEQRAFLTTMFSTRRDLLLP